MTSQAKVYVAVIASFSEDGNLFPKHLLWEDGRKYSIEKILDVRPAAVLKAGGQGDRYLVQIKGRHSYLFFERSPNINTEVIIKICEALKCDICDMMEIIENKSSDIESNEDEYKSSS